MEDLVKLIRQVLLFILGFCLILGAFAFWKFVIMHP